MLKFANVLISRDAALTIPQCVGLWEIPLLEAVFPTVTVGEEVLVDREAPGVEDEFARLRTRYGRSENDDGSKGLPFVEAVYGQHGIGKGRLAEAIKAATVDAPAADAADLVGAA